MSRKELISNLSALGEDADYLEDLSNTELEILYEEKTSKSDFYEDEY